MIGKALAWVWWLIVLATAEFWTAYLCFAVHPREPHLSKAYYANHFVWHWNAANRAPFILLSLVEFVVICLWAWLTLLEEKS